MSKHIIHNQQVFLEIPKKEEAFNFQNRVSNLFKNGLQYSLEKALDNMSTKNEVIRIDTLKLDLGVIDGRNFEKEFEERFIDALNNTVLTQKTNPAKENNVTVIEHKQSQQDAFIYFLRHGALPWYCDTKDINVWEKEILAQWKPENIRFVLRWLKENHTAYPHIVRRLVLQFSNPFLQQFVSQIFTVQTEKWRTLYDDLTYVLIEISAKNPVIVRNEIWIDIFDLLLNRQKGGELSERFVVVKLIAAQLRHSPVAVNQVIVQGDKLAENSKTTTVQNVLSNIIYQIQRKKVAGKSIEPLDDDLLNIIYEEAAENKRIGEEQKNEDVIFEDIGEEKEPDENIITMPANTVESKENIRPASKKKTDKKEEVLFITNCGLVLLHPFLEMYFSELGLIEHKKFVNKEAQERAVLLLFYLGTGETEVAEFNLVLQKILCGFPLEETLPLSIELSLKEKEESERLLRSVIDHWPPLKNTSLAGLRSTFLQRDGKLSATDNGWLLHVEQKAVDILIGKLPWGFSTVRLPWMDNTLYTEWC